MQRLRSTVNVEKRKRANVEQNSKRHKSRTNGVVRGQNKSLAYLFQSLDSCAEENSEPVSSRAEKCNIEKSYIECESPTDQVECASIFTSTLPQYKYLCELLYAMYLVTFTEKAQLHRTEFTNCITNKNDNRAIIKDIVKETGSTDDSCLEKHVREQRNQTNIQSNGIISSIANSDFDQNSEASSTTTNCAPLFNENDTMEIKLHDNSNVTCTQAMPYVSNMIGTRWRAAVEQFCRHTVQLDDIARVAFLFPEWIDVKWQFSSAIPSLSFTNLYNANNKYNTFTNFNKTKLEKSFVYRTEDTLREEIMMDKKMEKEYSQQESFCGVGELTARVYYLQSRVPCLEQLIARQCTNEKHMQEYNCNNNVQRLHASDLERITAYGCYLAQKRKSKNPVQRELTPINANKIQMNNFCVNTVECTHKKPIEMNENNVNLQCVNNHSWMNDNSCKENTLTNKNATCSRNATSLPFASQECKSTKTVTNWASQLSERCTKCEVSDDALLAQLSHELRSSLSEHKLQELLRQMRRDITRADEREKEELERQQECERIVHSYEHICALFSRKQSSINAWELINTMEAENRFDDKRRAVQQLELLLQYPESGLHAFSIEVNNLNFKPTRKKEEANHNGTHEHLVQDNVNDTLNITLMHNVKTFTQLSPTQLKRVLIKFDHTSACVQKLIKNVERHITRNVNSKLEGK